MVTGLNGPQRHYRILHSSGDLVAADRAVALARLGDLPGAKLFIVEADTPSTNEPALPCRRSAKAAGERAHRE